MDNAFDEMEGSRIQSIVRQDDYWQINTNEFTLNIFNPFMCVCYNTQLVSVNEENKDFYVNQIVTNVIFEDGKSLLLELGSKLKLYVSLTEDDYTTPEALSLHYETGEIIVI